MNPRLPRRMVVVAVVLLLVVSVTPSVHAQSKTLRWLRWDADIQINSDGTFGVSEVFDIEFIGGDFTFGYRNIPISQFVRIEGVAVREGATEYAESYNEDDHTFYVTRDSGEYVINWFYPPTRDARRVFTVEYTVVGGIIIDEEVGDRFFWKAVGPDHAFSIESSTVTVHMPPGATVDTSLEPAFFGVPTIYSISDDLTSVTFETTDVIPVNQEFEVGVRFPHGFVPAEKPPWQAAYEKEQTWNDTLRPMLNLILGGLGILFLLGGGLGVYFLWLVAGRDPDVGPVPSYLTSPPSDLPPSLVGTLVDEKVDLQDIIASLVDLARRGAIEIEERQKKLFGFTTSNEFIYRKLSDFNEPLREYEQLLLRSIFGSRKEVEQSDLQEKFYNKIPKLQKALYEEAVKEGLFPSSPQAVRRRYTGLGVAGIVLAAGVGFCVMGAISNPIDTVLCPFISLGVVSITLMIIGQAMPVKSRKGAEEAAKWRAFKQYLKNAERYADLEEVTEQFDLYLPYAIAFGLERTWINKFSRTQNTPMPGWYIPYGMSHLHRHGGMAKSGQGAAGGKPRDLRSQAVRPAPSLSGMSDSISTGLVSMSAGLSSMLSSTASMMTSVPSSSSSGGGFSGGGFSGGGFSGGGGGGGGGAGFG